jgi:electron transfer flavoprotein alpha subunit
MSGGNIDDYKGLWVFVEQRDGQPARVSLELLSAGRALADKLDAQVTALLIGDGIREIAPGLISYGADRVMVAENPVAKEYRTEVYADIIVEQALTGKPEIVLIGATCLGRDLAPRIAARLRTGCTADCTELDIDTDTGALVATKPYFGRNLMADIVCPFHRPQMVTVRPGVMELKVQDRGRHGEIIPVDVNIKESDTRVKVIDTVRSAPEGVPLEEAVRVVACGIGVGDVEGFEAVRELADLLGAQLGATSLPVDEGWISEDRKIGQTGKTIKPKLYIGCGVSGAIQHSAGMINSECIVAINTNPKAEIFDFADYGIIGDVNKVVPALVQQLRTLTSRPLQH